MLRDQVCDDALNTTESNDNFMALACDERPLKFLHRAPWSDGYGHDSTTVFADIA